MATVDAPGQESGQELLALLDQEVNRLPDKYRLPVILCELQGRSRKEVAGQLQIPAGTLSSRLAQAKKLLAARLTRRGVVLTAGGLTAALSQGASSGGVPALLLSATARAGIQVAVGKGLAAGVVSAHVVTLTEGVMKAMFLSKLKAVVAVALGLLVGAGAFGLTYRTVAAQPSRPGAGPQAVAQAGAPSAAPQGRAAADELEELRLEVAALRKGLQAVRARVKTLEGEVRTLRDSGQAAAIDLGFPNQSAVPVAIDLGFPNTRIVHFENRSEVKLPDPLAQAEAAVKKLRANPADKQALDTLGQALKQLKERAQPKASSPKQPAK